MRESELETNQRFWEEIVSLSLQNAERDTKKKTQKPIGQKCEAIDVMIEQKKENLLSFEGERKRENSNNNKLIEHRASSISQFKHSFVSSRFVHTQHILKLMPNCTAVTYSIGKDTEK